MDDGSRMNKAELEAWIKKLTEEDKLYRFYKSKAWKELKEKILRKHHYECLWCREKGKIARAEEVHHVQWVKKHPGLALSEYYTYNGETYRNLIPLCHDCHDMAHKRMKYRPKAEALTEERW